MVKLQLACLCNKTRQKIITSLRLPLLARFHYPFLAEAPVHVLLLFSAELCLCHIPLWGSGHMALHYDLVAIFNSYNRMSCMLPLPRNPGAGRDLRSVRVGR
jgi:hypothetical protein